MTLNPARNEFNLELAEEERIVAVTSRHWIHLFVRAVLPLLLALLTTALLLFRLRGGRLFVFGAALPSEFDRTNALLAICVGALALAWFISRLRAPKERSLRVVIDIVILTLLGLLAFRYSGGRVFVLSEVDRSGFDLFNRLLLVLILSLVGVCVYLWVDWRDDAIILTTRRVVYDYRVLLQRHVKDEVELVNVQKAFASQQSYFSHYLNYGTLVVQPMLAPRRITFTSARNPLAFEKQINDELKRVQNTESSRSYDAMVEKSVFGNKPAPPRLPVPLRTARIPKMLDWLFYANPEIDDAKSMITWRPHWLFAFRELLPSFSFLILGIILLLIAVQQSLVIGFYAVVGGMVLFLVCLVWAAYQYRDTRDDELILTPESIVDRKKKPFGPEDRRASSLGAVQNVRTETTWLGQLIGYGTVYVQTAGDNAKGLVFEEIPNPREAAGLINDYLREYRRGDRERSLSDTLTLLRLLHEEQVLRGELEQPDATRQ